MTVRENALDAIEKDENIGCKDAFGSDTDEDKDEDGFPLNADMCFENLSPEENEAAVLKLDETSDDALVHDEYDPLIFPDSFFSDTETGSGSEKRDKEPFDLSNLFPIDSPLEFAPTDKDELFDDFFDKKSSQHYDPIEEEELLTVDGSGFEPEDLEDERVPAIENLSPPIAAVPQSPVIPQFIPPVPQSPVPAAEPIAPAQTVPPVQSTPQQSAPSPLRDMSLDDMPFEPEFLEPESQPETENPEPFVPAAPRPEKNEDFEDENPLPEEMPIDTEPPLFDEDFPVEDDRPLEVLDSAEEPVAEEEQNTQNEEVKAPEEAEEPEEPEEDVESSIDLVEPEEDEDFDEMLMNQVRKVLDDVFDTSPIEEFSRTFEMFNSLRGLCSYLPDEKKDEFFSDLNRVKLDYVIDRLEGKPGLLAAAQALHSSGLVKPYAGSPKREFLQRTLSYMDSLANTLSDKGHARALRKEIHRVINRLKKNRR